jgi:hypothetical protein
MSIKSINLLDVSYMPHVLVVNNNHQLFINSKMCLCSLLECVAIVSLLLVLSYTSFYVELQYLTILKYLFKWIKFILKLCYSLETILFYAGFSYEWDGIGAWCVYTAYDLFTKLCPL